jgi:two-component system NtrC family response regulator
MVARGAFREDLYFRLKVVTIQVPPLRERAEDILPLAEHFLRILAEREGIGGPKLLSAEAQKHLLAYHWPGNVREVFNAMEHASVFAEGDVIGPKCLPPPLNSVNGETDANSASPELNLELAERRMIISAIERSAGNRAAAARLLGIEPRRLKRKIAALNIQLPRHPR